LDELLGRGVGNGLEQDAESRASRCDAWWHGWLGPAWIVRLQRALRIASTRDKPPALQLRLHEPRDAPGHGERRMPDDCMRTGDSSLGENWKPETTA